MRYFLVLDFGTLAEAKNKNELWQLFGGVKAVKEENGGVLPDVYEYNSKEDFEEECDNDFYDVA